MIICVTFLVVIALIYHFRHLFNFHFNQETLFNNYINISNTNNTNVQNDKLNNMDIEKIHRAKSFSPRKIRKNNIKSKL